MKISPYTLPTLLLISYLLVLIFEKNNYPAPEPKIHCYKQSMKHTQTMFHRMDCPTKDTIIKHE